MFEWFSAIELAGKPGLPSTGRSVSRMAKREDWKFRARRAQGGGKEYHISSLPEETQAALRQKAVETPRRGLTVVDNTGKTPPLTPPRDELGLTPDERAILEKYRQLDDQLKTQSQSILDIFSQQQIKRGNDEG